MRTLTKLEHRHLKINVFCRIITVCYTYGEISKQMIALLNKILNRFGFQLVSTKPVKPDTRLVDATVKFMNENPKYFEGCDLQSTYIGDINYVQEFVKGEFPQVSGTTYFKSQIRTEDKPFFNYDGEKLSEYQLKKKLEK